MSKHDNITGSIKQSLYEIMKNGMTSSPRGLETKELLNHGFTLTRPERNILVSEARGDIKPYLAGELEWYFSGSRKVEDIAKYSKFWNRIANPDGTVNSNYGHFCFHQPLTEYDNKSQFDWCLDELVRNKDSRAAIINFNQPEHKYAHNRDQVCTMYTQFLIRQDKLHMFTYMRSQDIMLGTPFDVPYFTMMQQMLTEELKDTYPDLQLGDYTHTATSFHIYANKYELATNMINEWVPGLLSQFTYDCLPKPDKHTRTNMLNGGNCELKEFIEEYKRETK